MSQQTLPKAVFFNNDGVITQHTPTCVENCYDDHLSYICLVKYYQFFCNLALFILKTEISII